jgi:hypothetical protein
MSGLLSRLLIWIEADPVRTARDWRAEAIERRIEVEILRELVVSMALGLEREQLPNQEREMLDAVLGGES